MTETRAEYMAGDSDASDEEMIERATEAMLSVMSARQFLALALKCQCVGRRGFGRVIGVWTHGKPELLMEEDRDLWR